MLRRSSSAICAVEWPCISSWRTCRWRAEVRVRQRGRIFPYIFDVTKDANHVSAVFEWDRTQFCRKAFTLDFRSAPRLSDPAAAQGGCGRRSRGLAVFLRRERRGHLLPPHIAQEPLSRRADPTNDAVAVNHVSRDADSLMRPSTSPVIPLRPATEEVWASEAWRVKPRGSDFGNALESTLVSGGCSNLTDWLERAKDAAG